jgi:hypothetical protein
MTRALRFAVLAAGLALGVFSMAVGRGGAGYSVSGSPAFAGAAELVAGYALLAVGFTAWMRPRQARLGVILVAASFAWFLLEWNNPAAGPRRAAGSASFAPAWAVRRAGAGRGGGRDGSAGA